MVVKNVHKQPSAALAAATHSASMSLEHDLPTHPAPTFQVNLPRPQPHQLASLPHYPRVVVTDEVDAL